MPIPLDPVARVALEEIQGGCPIADAHHVEAIADALTPEPATRLRVDVVTTTKLPDGLEGLALPSGRVLVRARKDAAREQIARHHELAHVAFDRAGIHHSHADVWCLTLALCAPLRLLRELARVGSLTVAALAEAAGMPPWAAAARLRMGAVSHFVR